MNNMLDYIEEYGDFSFKEKAFNEVDNLIFSQLAYTDFYFTDVPWPDFSKQELEKAIEQYNRRDRPYGGDKEL